VAQTTGALRLREGRIIGAIWTVRGEVVHALYVQDDARIEGEEAFDRLLYLQAGSFYWELDALPPTRSIRLPEPEDVDMAAGVSGAESADPIWPDTLISQWEAELKARVPGLSSIQVVELDNTRVQREPVNLNLIRTPEHLHLSVKVATLDIHLSATPDTAPEALLWAAEVMRRKLHERLDSTASVPALRAIT
jgi:hypothetical protein